MSKYTVNDLGFYGNYGGAYIPEILYKTVENLKPSAPGATIVEGAVLNGRPNEAKLKAFAEKY